MDTVDAAVIGSRPERPGRGRAAWPRAGWKVAVFELAPVTGGAVASAPLTVAGLHPRPVLRLLPASCTPRRSSRPWTLGGASEWARFAHAGRWAAVGPRSAAFLHADLPGHRYRPRLADDIRPDGQAWLDLYRWWENVGTRFFAMMLAPVGKLARRHCGSGSPPGARALRDGADAAPADGCLRPRTRFGVPGAQALLGADHRTRTSRSTCPAAGPPP